MMDNDIIEAFIEYVFPPQSTIVWKPEEAAPENRFWLVPGDDGFPRWLLPDNPDDGAYSLGQWHGYSRVFRWKKGVLQSLYDEGLMSRLPGAVQIGVELPEDADWGHLGWAEESEPIPVAFLGQNNPKSRIVVFLVSPEEDRPTLVAKVPFGPKAAHCNIREGIFLGQVQLEKPGVAPELVFLDNQSGVMAEDPVFGKPSPTELTDLHIDYLLSLRVPDFTITLEQKINYLKGGLDVWEHISREQRAFIETVLDRISDTTAIPAVWVNGDFSPRNIKIVSDTELGVMDWEHSESRGTPLYDITRFFFSQRSESNPPTMAEITENPQVQRYVQALELDPELYPKLFLYFVMDYWIRRVRDGINVDAEVYYGMMKRIMESTEVASS